MIASWKCVLPVFTTPSGTSWALLAEEAAQGFSRGGQEECAL